VSPPPTDPAGSGLWSDMDERIGLIGHWWQRYHQTDKVGYLDNLKNVALAIVLLANGEIAAHGERTRDPF